jgi:glycosyltransferase involved in cell wall biosynthesis
MKRLFCMAVVRGKGAIKMVGTAVKSTDMADHMPANEASSLELSVIIPCLNEADTLEPCIRKAQRALDEHKIAGEIIVADNGSTDGSQAIAARMGVRVIHVEAKGYGSALMGGIAAARGKFIIMGDADDSYDFLEIPRFVEKLRQGFDLVQGCRLPAGGGRVMPGAMPFLHRWWGNPMFSLMARWWFHTPIHDVYCGLRGFKKELYESLDQRCTGMEFATEMIIKSSLFGAKVAEVPITLHPDGRKSHTPHLKTFRDGWRTLRFFLLSCPRWLFFMPGALFVLLGVIGYGLAIPGVTLKGVTFDAHTLLFASLAILCGYQSIFFALFTKTFAIREGLMPEDRRIIRFFEHVNLERGLTVASAVLLFGLVLLLGAVNEWYLADFGLLDYAKTMRWVIPGAMFTALGFQTILSSFLVSILGVTVQPVNQETPRDAYTSGRLQSLAAGTARSRRKGLPGRRQSGHREQAGVAA